MDFEKYYKIMLDGTYCIHFANKKGYTREEISDMFSHYGNILSIFSKGDIINGLIFIRYKTLKETLFCLENLKKNNDIWILPQKDKIGKQNIQKNLNEWQTEGTANLFKKCSTTNKQHHLNSTSYKNNFEEQSRYSERDSDYDNGSDNFSNPGSTKHDYNRFNVSSIKQDKLNSSVLDEKLPKQQNYSYKALCYNQAKQQEINVHKLSKSEENTSIKTSNSNQISSLIAEPKIETNTKFYQSSGCIKNTASKSVVTMVEVIVANIHSNYNVNYILHLFEKYSPIYATFVKTICKTDIRYCHIYFSNVNDAVAIEKKFDNFALSEKNLIVLQTSQILNKVICK